MVGDGFLRKSELLADAPYGLSLHEQTQDFELARRQRFDFRLAGLRRRWRDDPTSFF